MHSNSLSIRLFVCFLWRSFVCLFALASSLSIEVCYLEYLPASCSTDPLSHTRSACDRLAGKGMRGLSFLLCASCGMTLRALCCVLGLLIVPFPISREAERIILVVHSGSTHVSGISHLPPCLIDEGALTCIWFPRYYIYFVLTYRELESEACCSVTVASCAC